MFVPQITFKTKIYHPNIDEKGQVCLPIISPENWKPATKTDQGLLCMWSGGGGGGGGGDMHGGGGGDAWERGRCVWWYIEESSAPNRKWSFSLHVNKWYFLLAACIL